MGTDDLLKRLNALRLEALNQKMDAVVAKQKLFKAFDYAEILASEMKEPVCRKITYSNVNLGREFANKRVNDNDDLLFFCAKILKAWGNDIEAQYYRKQLHWVN
jgi:hypothetical protein